MILVALAGLLGAAGVALAAVAAHVEDSVALRAAAEMAMVHASAGVGLVALQRSGGVRFAWVWSLVTAGLVLGAGVFTGAVASSSLAEFRIPNAAPIGGSVTILAWFGVFVAGLVEWFGQRARSE